MQRIALLFTMLLVAAAVGPAVGVTAADSTTAAALDTPAADVGDGVASHGGGSVTCSFPYTTTDATGTEVTIDADPERVVTLNPSAAQTMWEIGAQDEVVGVSQYATYLDGADAKVNVSGAGGPSVETVLATNPDLVLVPNSTYGFAADRVEQIRAQGVPVFVFSQGTSLEFVANKTERIGRLTGNCEAGIERAAEMRRSLDLMRRALEGEERPVALNVFYGFTSGANTFIGDVMETAGLRNGAAAAGISGFQRINDETVVEMNPTWIVAPEGSPIPKNEAYNSTTAVREGNIVRVNADYLQQPAPRSVLAAETILERVHPDAYDEYLTLKNQSTTTSATSTSAPTTSASTPDDESPSSTESPGFGIAATVVALAAAALLATRRRY